MTFPDISTMENPLLDTSGLPHFSAIRAEHVEPALDQILTPVRGKPRPSGRGRIARTP